ncbi:hypothetical protein [Streptomyces violaceusniger]|uniref:Uncharacterized protein n=1 Tax=Streptomyces violaceusniger (strain Tu 4113) TaxID=653045 RepID=G2P7A7_STRV4|nr:hypothetical protein [Streptomyces violaceusniger]AEM87067.1 hypothetical protein Strvi_7732 [Streptomyces violaceusniger Tu 4113]
MSGTATTVRRPTEGAAMAGGKYARPLPPLPTLFEGLKTARAMHDRYGVRLFQAAIQRSVGRTMGGAR